MKHTNQFILGSLIGLILLALSEDVCAQVDTAWVRHALFGSSSQPPGMAIDPSGNVYVAGFYDTTLGGATYRWNLIIKYDNNGELEWRAYFGGGFNNHFLFPPPMVVLAVDQFGNVYAAGPRESWRTDYDYCTVKFSNFGGAAWENWYNSPADGNDVPTSIAVDSEGNVYVTGYSRGSGTFDDYATVKYNGSGVEQWVARYNGPGNGYDVAFALAVDASGNVYVTGYSPGSGTGDDYATVKYNSSGAEQWVARYNGPGNSADDALALAVDASGNVYVTGASPGSGTSTDYATVKYNGSGVEQWVARYNGPGNSYDVAYALAVDASGNVYVTGYSSAGSSHVYTTIKYEQLATSVREIGTGAPGKFMLDQNYPNPFNPSTTISYQLPTQSHVTLKIVDALGREVATLVDAVEEPGYKSVDFDASGLASGVYVYKMQAGEFAQARKLLLLK